MENGSMLVLVQDQEGQSLPGASVLIAGPTHREGMTNVEGKAIFQDLPPGNYKVKAQLEGFKPDTEPTAVEPQQTAELTFRLKLDP
ncbi:MAG: carboxypeptidase-like regulatory domain-containing protein [Pseudomonadota bacterium]